MFRCSKCGNQYDENSTVCPFCGNAKEDQYDDDFDYDFVEKPAAVKKRTVSKKSGNKGPIVGIVMGILIIALGVVAFISEPSLRNHNASNYNVDYAAFGGDFYTEIYNASDTIVDELDDINSGVAAITYDIEDAAKVLNRAISFLIISVGLATIGISSSQVRKN